MTKTVQYVALAPNSRHCCTYDDVRPWGVFGYTYLQKSDTIYDDHPVTHIELRPDVEILSDDPEGVTISWNPDKPCPFVRLDDAH